MTDSSTFEREEDVGRINSSEFGLEQVDYQHFLGKGVVLVHGHEVE